MLTLKIEFLLCPSVEEVPNPAGQGARYGE
jgi:hypothetical protein